MALWINIEVIPHKRAMINLDHVLQIEALDAPSGGYRTRLLFATGKEVMVAEPYANITMHINGSIGGQPSA